MRIGFIGTGNMGLPMLGNLLKAGFAAVAYDAAPAALEAAARLGAPRAGSAAEAAAASDLVISIVPSSANVLAAYLGPGGILEGAKKGELCIAKSSGATWVMEKNHPVPGVDPASAASRDYAPGFMTDLMAKDLGLAVEAARQQRVPAAVAAAAHQIYRMASAHGLGRKDCAAVYRFLAPSGDDAPV